MNNQSLFRLTLILFFIVLIMPVLASYVGMAIHGDMKGTDAGVAPLLIGVYNIPFVAAMFIALIISLSRGKKGNYSASKIALIVALVIGAASLVMVIPWGLMQ